MRSLLLLVFVLLGLWANAQIGYHVIDSLEEAAKQQSGGLKISTLQSLSKELDNLSIDEGIVVLEQAVQEAQLTRDKHLIAQTNYDLADAYFKNYDFDLAERCLRQALANCGKDDDKLNCDICSKIGYIHIKTGNVDTAAFYFEQSCKTAQALDDKAAYANAVHNLALISRDKGDIIAARKGFEKAVGLYYEINDSLSAARNLSNVALLYLTDKQYDEAYSRLSALMPFFERAGMYDDLARAYSNMGLICSRKDPDLDTAMLFLEKAKHYATLANDSLMMVDVLLNEGDLYLMQGQLGQAFSNFDNAMQLSVRLGLNESMTATYVRLAEGHYIEGNYDKALEDINLCMAKEKETGTFLYTPLLKPLLLRTYAHLGEYDSLDAEIVRGDKRYDELLAEKQQLENEVGDYDAVSDENEQLTAKIHKMRYVLAGLATLIAVLALCLVLSGTAKKEK